MDLDTRHLLVLVLALVGCEAPVLTEVLVAVDTDLSVPDEVDRIVIDVRGPDGSRRIAEGLLRQEADLPSVLGVLPGPNADGEVTVHAVAMLGDTERLRQTSKFSFVPDQVRVLWLHLERSCLTISCGDEETCSEGDCSEVAVDELSPYDPPLTRPSADGGVFVDGGMSSDGGSSDDGGLPGPDASMPDAFVADGGVDPSCSGLPDPCGVGADACACDDCDCSVRCAGDCSVDCRSSDDCSVDAADTGSDFTGVCQASMCQFDARNAASVDIAARAGGILELDCSGVDSCEVTCRGTSECLVRCDGAVSCGITCSPGSEVTCAGDVRVCNRACP